MKTYQRFILLILLTVAVSQGCKKYDTGGQKAPESTQKVNQFIKDVMDDVYLWYKNMPNLDIRYENDSKAYFNKLLYKTDKWSFITDNIQALENSFQGTEKSYGWSLAFGKFVNTQKVFALVEFVYPDTPADIAGLKRGDMIFKIDNADLTTDNYTDLLYTDNLSCTYGQYNVDTKSIDNSKTADLAARELQLDPVLYTKIIEESGHKIGYFLYAQFIEKYTYSLDTVFQKFANEGVNDVVIDLRYNPGGTLYAAQYLCSSLAPLSDVENGNVLVKLQWNDKRQSYLEQNAIMNLLEVRLFNSVPYKMGLNKVYFLTGQGTASASELTITGLMPYMDVVTVGDTTYGKYTASQTFKPEDIYSDQSYYKDIDNWGIQPIIARYSNSQGFTDFIYGLYPTIQVNDDIAAGIPLGDKEEPLLKAAIEDITGTEVVAKKRATIKPFKIFDRGFSRFDANKRDVLLNLNDSKSIDR